MEIYDSKFYAIQSTASRKSADVIVPMLVKGFHPKSVVDVGCGVATWAASFLENGVNDIVGIDGDWVEESQLQIPREKFLRADLKKPLKLGRRFDLAISLEVAEHLPEDAAATFVDTLTSLAPVVVFSAAIPSQGGTHHINEQWQSYWVSRFAERGFVAYDCIRHRVWNNQDVCWWYAQNTVVFVSANHLAERGSPYEGLGAPGAESIWDLVHPRRFQIAVNAVRGVPHSLGLGAVLRALPEMTLRSVSTRLSRLVSAQPSSGL